MAGKNIGNVYVSVIQHGDSSAAVALQNCDRASRLVESDDAPTVLCHCNVSMSGLALASFATQLR
jgi:hypothetical protein